MSPRIKAFLIHLAISLLLLIAILYVVIFIWYPPPFFAADGGWQGVRIMIGVDLVLGPLLTLAVYNPGKGMTKLRRDLWTIGFIQISALCAGGWIVAGERTAMVVFADDRFVTMSPKQVEDSGVSRAVLESLKGDHPTMAFVGLPENEAERDAYVFSTLGDTPLFKRGERYEPLSKENRQRIMARGYELDKVVLVKPALADVVEAFLSRERKRPEEVAALPLYCRYDVLSLVLDRETGEILDTIAISHDELIASRSWKRLQETGELPE